MAVLLRLSTILAVLGTCAFQIASTYKTCYIGTMHGAEKFDAGMQLSVLPYHNPCGCSAVRLGGIVVNNPLIAPHPTEGLFLSENTDEIRQHLDCPRRIGSITAPSVTTLPVGCDTSLPLGLTIDSEGPLSISNSMFTASSTDGSGFFTSSPAYGRLNFTGGAGKTGAWRPDSDTAGQWIQVDLGREAVVTGVIVQGRSAHDGSEQQQWVTEYAVEYASEGYPTRQTVQDGEGNVATFPGSTDSDSSMTSRFYGAILANVICIKPTSWYSGVALRFELLGCLPS